MKGFEKFCSQFTFNEHIAGCIGVEREAFLLRDGTIVPIAEEVLNHLTNHADNRGDYGYELSACQLEDRIGPVWLEDLKKALFTREQDLALAEHALGFTRLYCDVAPATMPLDIYPDPTGRYQKITQNMPRDILSAACRVAGTHIHIGMPDRGSALEIYNEVIAGCDRLCRMGDGSSGERLRLYRQMAPDWRPPRYESWEDFYEEAVAKGFVDDPRRCWHLIRISKHGTLEFRMFGATSDIEKIIKWAKRCFRICGCAKFRNIACPALFDWLY